MISTSTIMSPIQEQHPLQPRTLPVYTSSNVPQTQSWTQWALECLGWNSDHEIPPLPENNTSFTFTTEGDRNSSLRIGGINGIATSLEGAISHAEYISRLTGGVATDFVYNHSNSAVVDAVEVSTLNFLGASPNTSRLLKENWVEFHEQNKKNPDVKYLQICHSQGAAHVRNALKDLPKEVRDRIIVVAIAPAVVVPRNLCFESFNYASKPDVVPKAELGVAGFFDSNETLSSKRVLEALERQQELIYVSPHPDAKGIDHDFQSLTYRELIEKIIKNYLIRKGEYK